MQMRNSKKFIIICSCIELIFFQEDFWMNIVGMVVLAVGQRILAFFFLLARAHRRST